MDGMDDDDYEPFETAAYLVLAGLAVVACLCVAGIVWLTWSAP